MHSFDSGPLGAQFHEVTGGGDDPERHSAFSLIALIAVVAVLAVMALGLVFLVLGFVASIAGAILKIVILAAVAAFIWKRVMRRCH
ncbi:MAG TPA: hypothetical protein VNF71_13330 [Acidimicrobiales bacterium]|nr:hypothetical protein [Acidimicrobiales bacterium]